MNTCTFCEVRDKKLPSKMLYEDDWVFVIQDTHPKKPVHLLVIPKEHISEFVLVKKPELFQKLFVVMQKMIKDTGLTDKPHKIKINGGGRQIVNHLHIHLMGPY